MRNTHSSLKSRVKLMLIRCIRLAIRLFAPLVKMRADSVLFVAFKRKGYGDNLKYIAEELRQAGALRLRWACGYPETCKEIVDKGIEVVRLRTLRYILCQLGSKVVVYNDAIPPYMPKRKGQVYINAWHGGMNFKHIGYDWLQDQSKTSLAKFALGNPQPDYYLSGSRFFSEDTAASFRFDPAVFLPWGLPRNDVLFDTSRHLALSAKVRETLGISSSVRIALYAPTFRNGYKSDAHGLDAEGLVDALGARFGGTWQLVYRGHYFVQGQSELQVTDASAYPDMQELLIASDALISDYSSAMWDMAFLRRPVFCYAPDLQSYMDNERSFACPIERWPYRVAQTNEELRRSLADFDEATYYPKVDAFLQECGCYERGDAAPKTAKLIQKICMGDKQ